jgi:hypothetical protein
MELKPLNVGLDFEWALSPIVVDPEFLSRIRIFPSQIPDPQHWQRLLGRALIFGFGLGTGRIRIWPF